MQIHLTIDTESIKQGDREILLALCNTFPGHPLFATRVAEGSATAVQAVLDTKIAHADLPSTGKPSEADNLDAEALKAFGNLPSVPSTVAAGALPTATILALPSAPASLPSAPISSTPATVPTLPAVPASPPAQDDTNRDSAGMPYDARIHSSSKKFVADGTWKYAKNLNPATKTAVESELRAAMGAPAATQASSPSVPNAVTAGTKTIFGDLLLRVGALKLSGKLTENQFFDMHSQMGVPSVMSLAARADICQVLLDHLNTPEYG